MLWAQRKNEISVVYMQQLFGLLSENPNRKSKPTDNFKINAKIFQFQHSKRYKSLSIHLARITDLFGGNISPKYFFWDTIGPTTDLAFMLTGFL